ncbi:MAG TPA: GTPase ObgE [bacterium]|nr:GTPase ObgE [bacterium]
MAAPQSFIDEATITVKAGDGGNGIAAFLREKYRPKGGPAGGDGGKGGDVYLKVAPGLVTLQEFHNKRHFKADRGQDGAGGNKNGKGAKDLTILVPPGTVVLDGDTGEELADLQRHGEKVLVAKGGQGGLGNQHFASSTNRAPTKHTLGTPGEEKTLRLELRLLADVGLVGFPNAGKSTFLNRVSNAKPRIASYPFTTLRPSVGIVKVGDFHSFSMADIPGIIEEAHAGKGLGLQFLRHIARTRILCHLIALRPEYADDITELVREYEIILGELEAYGEGLMEKARVTVLNKIDILPSSLHAEQLREAFITATNCPTAVYLTSTQTGMGLEELVLDLMKAVSEGREDPHTGLEIRYALPEAHLNVREVTPDAARWWEGEARRQQEALDAEELAALERDEAEAMIELPDGTVVEVTGVRSRPAGKRGRE